MPRSQNGYPANDRSLIHTQRVSGTNVDVHVRKGPAGDLLVRALVHVDRNVEPISTLKGGIPDDWSYAQRLIRNGFNLSNHASGTAVDFNALLHPLGKRGTFTKAQIASMHAFLELCEGAIRWGEDYRVRKDGMHLEIMADETTCARILRKLDARHEHRAGSRDLRRGMVGADVEVLQRKLGAKVDGIYGKDTAARVLRRERAHNRLAPAKRAGYSGRLLADGQVGVNTWRVLGVTPTYKPKAVRK